MFDATVIGGGPAGSATAIRLAGLGLQVQLFEKARFPRRKLCGGFLSGECLADLEKLEVLEAIERAGAWRVRRVVLVSARGGRAEANLPSTSLSLSRAQLDAVLLERARAAGVQVQEGTDGASHPPEAPWLVIASGRSTPTLPSRQTLYYGIQTDFEDAQGVTDQVELDLVAGGYVGLVRQTLSRINLCALVTAQVFQRYGRDLDSVLHGFSRENPALRRHLQAARRVSSWQTVGPVTMGLRRLSGPGCLYVGDAACVVDPFAGEGIAMALQGAALAAQAFRQNLLPIPEAYEQAWHQRFDSALRVDRLLRQVVGQRFLQEFVLGVLRIFPHGLRRLTEWTRPPHAAAPSTELL